MHSLVTAVFQKLCPSNQCESYIQILINHVLYYIFFIIFIHLGKTFQNESRLVFTHPLPIPGINHRGRVSGVKPKDKLRPEALVKLEHETPQGRGENKQKYLKAATQEMEVLVRIFFSFSIG